MAKGTATPCCAEAAALTATELMSYAFAAARSAAIRLARAGDGFCSQDRATLRQKRHSNSQHTDWTSTEGEWWLARVLTFLSSELTFLMLVAVGNTCSWSSRIVSAAPGGRD